MAKDTQKKILSSAEHLFREHGHKATSLDKIAHDAGQSKGAVFHYFKNKDEITAHVLEHYAQEAIFEEMKTHFETHQDVKDALKSYLNAMQNDVKARDFKGGCLLGNMALELSDQDAHRASISSLFQTWEDTLVGYLEDPARGADMVLPPRRFARLFIAGLQGVVMSAKAHKDETRTGDEFEALNELIEGFIV